MLAKASAAAKRMSELNNKDPFKKTASESKPSLPPAPLFPVNPKFQSLFFKWVFVL